jgi:hypothetical protein
MWTVLLFQTPSDLQTYLRTGNGGGAVVAAKVFTIYFDGASGRHVLVMSP